MQRSRANTVKRPAFDDGIAEALPELKAAKRRKDELKAKDKEGLRYRLTDPTWVYKGEPLQAAIVRMDKVQLDMIPVFNHDKENVGTITRDSIRIRAKQNPGDFNGRKVRCDEIMAGPLPCLKTDASPATVGTQVGVHGGVLIREGDDFVGLVIGRLDSTKAETMHDVRWGPRKHTGRPSIPAIRRKSGGTYGLDATPTAKEGSGGDSLADADYLADVRGDAWGNLRGFRTTRKGESAPSADIDGDYLADVRGRMWEKLRGIKIRGKEAPEAPAQDSEAPEGGDFADDERLYARFLAESRIKRGKKPVPQQPMEVTPILHELKVQWTDGYGRKRVESLKEKNQALARLVLQEQGKLDMLEKDHLDTMAQHRILTTVRKYLKKHNRGALTKFNTNRAIYLGEFGTLAERVAIARSEDDFVPAAALRQKKAVERAEERARQKEKEELKVAKAYQQSREEDSMARARKREEIMDAMAEITAAAPNFPKKGYLGFEDAETLMRRFPGSSHGELESIYGDWRDAYRATHRTK
jgi:hypothetical protein